MLNTCQKRCLKNDGDKLTKGENLCIDKCTIKYYKVVDMMDTLMQKKMQDQKEKMESLLEAQSGTENSINDTAGK